MIPFQEIYCYLDSILSDEKSFTEKQIMMLIWEAIIETSDTTLVTAEWAMYELAKDPVKQVVTLDPFCDSIMHSVLYDFSFSDFTIIHRTVCFGISKMFVDRTRLPRRTWVN